MKTIISKALRLKRDAAKTYNALHKVALKAIKNTITFLKKKGDKKPKIYEFCGPISTGGVGNAKDNIKILHNAINKVSKLGYHIFNQVPFENKLGEIKAKRKEKIGDKYDMKLLTKFYAPIFASGLISTFIFMPGWRDSTGSQWEYKQAKKNKIKTRELKPDWESLIAKGETDIKKLTFKI